MNNKFFMLVLFFLLMKSAFAYKIELSSEEKNWIKSHPSIILGSDDQWAPYIIKDKNGLISGYDKEILDLVNKYTGANFILKSGRWKDMLEEAKIKTIDGLSTSAIHKSREEFFGFSENYISTKRLMVISNTNPKNIKSLEDLDGKVIAYQEKNLFDKKQVSRFKNSKLVPLKSLEDILDKLIKGEVDSALGSHALIYLANKLELPYIKVLDVLPNSTLNLVFSIRKDHPLTLSILNKGLNAISEDEKVRLKNKWFFTEVNNYTLPNNIGKTTELTKLEKDYLKDKKVIKMCVLPNWLPFEQINEEGKHKGIGNDIMKIISKQIETPIILLPTEKWADSLQNIRDRKCDILPVAMDVPSRRDSMNFTKAYTAEPFVIATKLDQFFIKDSISIGNRKVGIVKSYAFIEVLKRRNPDIQIVTVKDAEEGLRRVRSGELFGYIDIMAAIGYNIQKHGMVDLKIAGKLEFDIKLSVASRNDEPLLNSIMQKSLDNISEEELRTIVKRWIEIKVEESIDYRSVFYIASIFFIVLLLILYKNRSINLINRKLTLANEKIEHQQEMVNKYVLILSTDLEGNIIDVNEAYCKALGYSKDELLGKTHSIVRHPDTSVTLINNMWETIRSNKIWNGKVYNYTKDKSTKYFNIYIEPLYNNGNKIGYRSISEDITDRYVLEELNQYQNSLLKLFENGDAVLFKWKNNDNNWDIEYVSDSVSKLTGYAKEDFLEKKVSYSSCIHKDDLDTVFNETNNVIKNNLSYFKHEPYRITTKDGKEKWLLDYMVTLNDSESNVTHFLTYVTDITEHIEQQRMIFQQSRTAAVGEMIGNIAHQWRQPLSLISTVSTGLKFSLEFEENIDKKMMIENLNKINNHTQHLSKTIDDFRGFFRDDLTVVRNNNIKDTIKKVRELTVDSFNNNFIEYHEDIESVSCEYNENIFIQALLNIYNNAKDALSQKEYKRYFYISVENHITNIIVRIKDNGGGIDEDVIEKIFEPYFTTKHKSVGTGIGLYMTNQIITKQLKGTISVSNISLNEHKGAEFIIKMNI